MEQRLIINGTEKGIVTCYRQDRLLRRWIFLLASGETISVNFSDIKIFTSSGNLEILTFH